MQATKDKLKTVDGPYKATKLWNEIVNGFCTGMPLKRHRRQLRQYSDCFTARDGVDWLHQFLQQNPNFGEDVTRSQALQLLSKLLQCNILVPVNSDSGSKSVVLDNQELYRFKCNRLKCQSVGSGINRIPLRACNIQETASNTDVNTNSKLEELPAAELTVEEVANVWKVTLLQRLSTLLKIEEVETALELDEINAKHLLHNVTRIGSSGVVLSLNKSQQISSWVYSAMKCLAVWPTACGDESCLPQYEGFEKDVFRVIEDYFKGLDEPLTTFSMYKPLVSVFERVITLSADVSASCLETEFSSEEPVTRLISPPRHKRREISSAICSINDVSRPSLNDAAKLKEKIRSCSVENLISPSRLSFKFKQKKRLASSTLNLQPSITSSTTSVTSSLSCQSLQTDGFSLLLECFRLLLLLLSPDSRRILHQLLIFVEKVSRNEQLSLCLHRTNRHLLLETFGPLLVNCSDKKLTNGPATITVSQFLMENQQQLFEVTEQFKTHVHHNLNQFQKQKGNCDGGLSYCEMVSKEEYERQKSQYFESAMTDLLNSIVVDKDLSQKSKDKKLKKFKKMHPDIYNKTFPVDPLLLSTGQTKSSNITKQLQKLVSLRI
ncbi:DEP domain containing [Chamberlinius hualienensis]